jgi:hypothetical protein
MTRNTAIKIAVHVTRWIKLAGFGAFAASLVAISLTASPAQTTRPLDPALVVPTTKLLAIGSFTAKATPSLSKPVLPSEVRETVRLYLNGKIDQWFIQQDQSGVVFIMNLTDPKEAHELLEKLPLGQAGLMEFQIIPLGPISPLRMLLSEPSK